MLLGHYLLRAWMHRSARQEPGLDADRLSFTETIEVVNVVLSLGTLVGEPLRPRLGAQQERQLQPEHTYTHP